jgi:hypothetical protein
MPRQGTEDSFPDFRADIESCFALQFIHGFPDGVEHTSVSAEQEHAPKAHDPLPFPFSQIAAALFVYEEIVRPQFQSQRYGFRLPPVQLGQEIIDFVALGGTPDSNEFRKPIMEAGQFRPDSRRDEDIRKQLGQKDAASDLQQGRHRGRVAHHGHDLAIPWTVRMSACASCSV